MYLSELTFYPANIRQISYYVHSSLGKKKDSETPRNYPLWSFVFENEAAERNCSTLWTGVDEWLFIAIENIRVTDSVVRADRCNWQTARPLSVQLHRISDALRAEFNARYLFTRTCK